MINDPSFADDQAELARYGAGEYAQLRGGNWNGWFASPDLRLIPPLSEAFSVYGGEDTVERARQWAVRGRYLLAAGPPACAHGLHMLNCPNLAAKCCGHFDHTEIWVPYDAPQSPFILTHPYRDQVTNGIRSYARAHALHVDADRPGDRWYNEGALPIRLTASHVETYAWNLGTKAIVLVHAFPSEWPDEIDTYPGEADQLRRALREADEGKVTPWVYDEDGGDWVYDEDGGDDA